MVFIYGRLQSELITEEEVQVFGGVDTPVITSNNRIVVVGRGVIGIIAGLECVLLSMKGPILVNTLRCKDAILLGRRYPVLVVDLSVGSIYARRVIASRVRARRAVISELCSIDEIEADEVVFTDPHSYIKNIKYIGRALFSYNIPE